MVPIRETGTGARTMLTLADDRIRPSQALRDPALRSHGPGERTTDDREHDADTEQCSPTVRTCA
ncbi:MULTISPECIES: hypothetical protein [Kocuria]|uniref:hypothetical protein n=1 Tax=Kocuria TaxID=57493 RepID=UPI00203B1E58|nr:MULTISPECIES: hypothetical protein [Kocuria]MCM3688989.1 hypothetical protein [Kocuria rosea]